MHRSVILPLGLTFLLVLTAISLMVPSVKADDLPPLPATLLPNEDVFTTPVQCDYPGTWNWYFFSYDHTPVYDSFADELRINHSSYVMLFKNPLTITYWAEYRCEFDDLGSTYDDWDAYEVSFYISKPGNWVAYYFGFYDPVNDATDVNSGGAASYIHYSVNPNTGVPFTKAEINALQGRIVIVATLGGGSQSTFEYFQLTATPIEYEPTTQYILRPYGDYPDKYPLIDDNTNMDWTSSGVGATNYSMINETTTGGDGETSYIFTANLGEHLTNGTFVMTNLPTTASRTHSYTIVIWAVCWLDAGVDVTGNFLALQPWHQYVQHAEYNPLMPYHAYPQVFPGPSQNITTAWDSVPDTGAQWSYDDINALMVWLPSWTQDGTRMNVTQMAVLVTTTTGLYEAVAPINISFWPNMISILWMALIFLPGSILAEKISPIGMGIGIALMLIVFQVSMTGFTPVLIIGLVAVGAILYKGD